VRIVAGGSSSIRATAPMLKIGRFVWGTAAG
jgi:hypothetical protein